MLCADLYLWVSNIRKAKRAVERLTHNLPRNRITSPITFTLPIRRMLLMIKSVATAEDLQKLLPVIAICKSNKHVFKNQSDEKLYKYIKPKGIKLQKPDLIWSNS